MNGRIYDPLLGRFLQADPFVQAPKNSQSLNRYSYVLNNPLSYTDPSGYFSLSRFVKKWGRVIVAAVATYFTAGWAAGLNLAASAAGNAAIAGAIGGAVGGGILTGTLKGAFYGALSGAALGAINASTLSNSSKTVLSGSSGGVINELQGGKFGHGFMSAGAGFWSGLKFGGKPSVGKFFGTTIAAGTISEVTGGKFENGAFSAAMAYTVAVSATAGRNPTASERTYARLAKGIYKNGFTGTDGYEFSELIDDPETGLRAGLFVNSKSGHRVFVFAGTNGPKDWRANFLQAFGKPSSQYELALAHADRLSAEGPIHFVGQSLGGGLASAAAIVTGQTATVFNAAGVHPSTVNGLLPVPGSITHFHSAYDVLQGANFLTPGARIYGERVSVGSGGWHPMEGVCRAMGC